jgi:type 1 glutamine amidotransferase
MSDRAIILAGDFYHKAPDAFEGIGPILREAGLAVTNSTDFAALGAAQLADKKLLVILRDGIEFPNGHDKPGVVWMQPAQEEAIEQFVLRGGAFLALHNAGWGYPWRGAYRRTLGGYYIGHPPLARFHVEVVNKSHPVTAGVASYDIDDEQHMLTFDYDRVQVLLTSQGQDGRGTVSGWAYEYGQGRVIYLPHGHTLEVIRHPSSLQLLRNATRWLLRQS